MVFLMTTIPIYAVGISNDAVAASQPLLVIEVPPRAVSIPVVSTIPRSQTGWYEEALAEWRATHSGREPGEVYESEVVIRPRWRDLDAKLKAAAELKASGLWGRVLNWLFPLVG